MTDDSQHKHASDRLRPNQIADYKEEHARISEALRERPEMVQDKSQAKKVLRSISNILATQAPKEIKGRDRDKAEARVKELRAEILVGMPSKEEMRKCPAGAVGKHRKWESANKPNINEYKNLMLGLNIGTDDHEVASIEKFRPTQSSLNMHNPLIEGTQYHNVDQVKGPVTVFSDSDLALMKQRAPEIAAKLCLMDTEGRKIAKQQYITGWVEPKK